VPLDQKPDHYTIRVAANVLPQLISGYAVTPLSQQSLITQDSLACAGAFVQETQHPAGADATEPQEA